MNGSSVGITRKLRLTFGCPSGLRVGLTVAPRIGGPLLEGQTSRDQVCPGATFELASKWMYLERLGLSRQALSGSGVRMAKTLLMP